jgi:hypothetical protein
MVHCFRRGRVITYNVVQFQITADIRSFPRRLSQTSQNWDSSSVEISSFASRIRQAFAVRPIVDTTTKASQSGTINEAEQIVAAKHQPHL